MRLSTHTIPAASSIDDARTNGIRDNHNKEFILTFQGQEIYDLLEMFRQQAMRADTFEQARKLVLAHETIFERARQKGF